jgi:type IV secretion system protein VirB10
MSLFRSRRPPSGTEPDRPAGNRSADELPGEAPEAASSVAGERAIASVNRARSLQSRITNLLAMGLMSALGVGLLGWYYAHTFASQSRARSRAQAASREQAQGDVPLPPLGPIAPSAPQERTPRSVIASALGAPPTPPPLMTSAVAAPGYPPAMGQAYGAVATPGAPAKSPQELALERKLSGPAFDRDPSSASATAGAPSVAAAPLPPSPAPTAPLESLPAGPVPAAAPARGGLQSWLVPTVTPTVRPAVLPTEQLLLPKGAFIDCTLETAIDSTLPGMTTCITATDTFSADGTTVLMERGTKLVGETRGEVQQGSARVFVLWTEARTPTGVVIPLASPGTDALGRAGLSGTVNRHFWQRFGAAILVSVIDGGVEYAVQSQSKGGAVIYDPGATQEVMTEALKGTIDIPPTVTVPNGSRIQVFVARDVDFRSVYELRPTAAR